MDAASSMSTTEVLSSHTGLAQSKAAEAGASQEFSHIVAVFSETSEVFEEAVEEIEDVKSEQDEEQLPELAQVGDLEEAIIEATEQFNFNPASSGTFGKTEYTVLRSQTLASIAEDHGQSVADIIIANPWLAGNTTLEAGTTIAFLDETRLGIAHEMASSSDLAELQELIRQEILYATVTSSTPVDLLPSLQHDFLARRATDDKEFVKLVDEQSNWASQLWQEQGRTHQTMDKLQTIALARDWDALKQEVLSMLRDAAWRSPTSEAIDEQISALLVYGLQDEGFASVVKDAQFYFNYGQVFEAAGAISNSYAYDGPIIASKLLAHNTSSHTFDPLTAARILNAAQPAVAQIISHLGYGEIHLWPGGPAGEPRYFTIDLDGKETIFGYLSTTVQNVSKTAASEGSVVNMADLINNQLFTYVAKAIAEENGAGLSLKMLNRKYELNLATMMFIGFGGLAISRRELMRSLQNTATEVSNPTIAWRDLLNEQQSALARMRNQI